MVDRVSASIVIGGNLPAIHVAAFTALIIDEGLSLDWEGQPFLAEQLSSGSPLALMAHEVALGRFGPLEDFCVANSLPYVRWCAGCSSWGAQRAVFTGEGAIRLFPVDGDDGVLIDRAAVMNLGNIEAITAYLDSADYVVPPLLIVDPESRLRADNQDHAKGIGGACCVVTVRAHGALDDLDIEDRGVPGLYAMALDQAAIDRHTSEEEPAVEAPKDLFHSCIPIGNLEHFWINFNIVANAQSVPEGAQWLNSSDSLSSKLSRLFRCHGAAESPFQRMQDNARPVPFRN